ncbi:redoxin domain-containing protein, partial [Capnocytophaga canimorsus]|uniref:redoxin domain-containing protein n=1 Tax=Capnocytophaga canimorsus TaxID=28188 RepID=UPI001EDCC387
MKSRQIGEVIPDFSGIDQNGNPIKLSDYKQRKGIIFFYPKASTPGCTAEVCNLRDGYEILKKGLMDKMVAKIFVMPYIISG